MEKLRELHDKVKEHPYRVSNEEKYWREYRTLLYELSHQVCDVLWPVGENGRRDYKAHRYQGACNMLHDFNGAILDHRLEHIDRCLQCIHKFLDTGKFSEFYTYYTGCNISPYMQRLRKYVFDEEEGKYHGVYTEVELTKRIEELEEKKAKAYAESEEKGKAWERWDGNTLAYYKEEKAYHDSHRG